MEKILITGATGFIGGFIVDEALRRGMDVWAAVRSTSRRTYLTDSRIHFIELNLSSEDELLRQLRGTSFDYVVHAAGVTKSSDRSAFRRVNTDGTANLVKALVKTGMDINLFVYLSSLSVYGPVREQYPYTDIKEEDTPCPDTAYGESKLRAEQFIRSFAAGNGLRYVIFRPTGVYGPREKDYFMMVQSISRHVDFAAGRKPQDITFVYVLDVVQAIFLAISLASEPDGGGVAGRSYFLSDGCVYRSSTFSELVRRELGDPWWIRVTAPLWLLRVITSCGELAGRLTGRITALNGDKYKIMRQRNWRCDISPAVRELGYKPRFQLEEGVRLTVKWYKDNGWI